MSGNEPELRARATQDWNPRAEVVLNDFVGVGDKLRHSCPVAYSDYLGWSVFRHRDVSQVLRDSALFSNAVSEHVAVPNGMDPPEHGTFRGLIEPYFSAQRVDLFEPVCRSLAADLLESTLESAELDAMECLAREYALQVQCAFMGWPVEVRETLRGWLERSRRATLAGCRQSGREVAQEFADVVAEIAEASSSRAQAGGDDVTSRLLRETVDGRPLSPTELTSIFRNWTVGELATIASALGIIMGYLAENSDLQANLRQDPRGIPIAIEEILRLDAPLLSNRRRVTTETELGGRQLRADDRLTVMWASANRDPEVFAEADRFRWDRDQSENLLYGAGIHVCPGAALARMELRVFLESLLGATSEIALCDSRPPVRALYPAAGYSSLTIRLERSTNGL